MFQPDWDEGCVSPSYFADNFTGAIIHLPARDTAFAATSRDTVETHRPRSPAIARNDSPPAREREISSRSLNDNRNRERVASGRAGRCNDRSARAIAHRERCT
jgi:hypothetical protein